MSRYSEKIDQSPAARPSAARALQAYASLRAQQRTLALIVVCCAAFGFTLSRGPAVLGNRGYLPVILATSVLTFAYTLRNSVVRPALAELRRDPQNPYALKRWQRNSLIVMILCGAVGIIGFAMQLFGAAVPVVAALYVIALAYLFLLGPIRP